MEGNEKIRLVHPDLSHRNRIGELVQGINKAEFDLWAKRHDRGGKEYEYGRTEALDFNTIFEIREMDAFKQIDETWYIEDQYGLTYDIQAVSRQRRYMGRYRILLLQAKKRVA